MPRSPAAPPRHLLRARPPRRAAVALVLALAALTGPLAGCRGNPVVTLEIVTSPGVDTFAGATRLRVRNADPAAEAETPLDGDAALTLDLTDVAAGGETTTVTVDALDDAGAVIARGASPPFTLLATETYLRIYVGRVGEFGAAPVSLPAARRDLGATTYLGLGAALIGGRDADGNPAGQTWFYNDYLHQLASGADLGAARSGLTAIEAADATVVVFGGATADGVSSLMEVFDPWQGYTGVWDAYSAEGNASLARAAAPAAVVTGGVLCAGGVDASGEPLASAVLLAVSDDPGASALPAPLAAPRADHTVTAQLDGAAALIYGGAAADAPVAERYDATARTFTALDLDPALMRTRHAAALLADGRVAIVGGLDADGVPSGDVVVVGTDGAATVFPAALQHPRSRHTATLVAGLLVVAGGEDADGARADAEVLDPATMTVVATPALGGARRGQAAVVLGSGTLLLAGGVDDADAPVARLELYTPPE